MKLLTYPNPLLKQRCQSVITFDSNLLSQLTEMSQAVITYKGLALAANQIGVLQRFFVVNAHSFPSDYPKWIINPVIVEEDNPKLLSESCLSLPGITAMTGRFTKITFTYQNELGNSHQFTAEGLYAQMVQHEIGHLDGHLFIDSISTIESNRIAPKLNKMRTRK